MFVFVGLGSNQGDRAANLRAGIAGFAQLTTGAPMWQSPVYESAPMYITDQPFFLNMVIGNTVRLKLMELLYQVKQLESRQGRDLSSDALRNGPRPLDIDILLAFDGDSLIARDARPKLLNTPELTVPHPKMAERAFVLFPLRDLAPDLVHPTLHQTMSELAAAVSGQAVHRWRE
jgi:2-amino-4-hydroxy-6-hydroxymethyldihydropteridine diphosphokinase